MGNKVIHDTFFLSFITSEHIDLPTTGGRLIYDTEGIQLVITFSAKT